MLIVVAGKSVLKNLGWYISNNLINAKAAKLMPQTINDAIKRLSPHSMKICDAFGIPKERLSAPMYTGYLKYYEKDYSQGEHNFKPKF